MAKQKSLTEKLAEIEDAQREVLLMQVPTLERIRDLLQSPAVVEALQKIEDDLVNLNDQRQNAAADVVLIARRTAMYFEQQLAELNPPPEEPSPGITLA